jgi:hypothetical protein
MLTNLAAFPDHPLLGHRLVPLIFAITLTMPSVAGENAILLGSSYGAVRTRPHRIIASLELTHELAASPFGVWGALEGTIKDGQFLGIGPFLKWSPGNGWVFAVGSGPGYYHHQSGLDLGCNLEFRSSFYVAHQLGRTGWLGMSGSHYSNAHLRPYNPGAETIGVFWSIPIFQH